MNLTDTTLEVYREPRGAPDDSRYGSIDVLRPPARVTPLGAPGSVIAVADLLP